MSRLGFAIAVGVTSVALVVVVGVIGLFAVRSAVAGAPWAAGGPWGGPWASGVQGFQLPPELQGLADLPADQRFSHFAGVQVNLKDKNNQPLTVNVTPGTATAASANSLTIAANDGTTKSFTLDGNTIVRGKPTQAGAQPTASSLASGDQVVVVTLNNDATARAVIDGGKDGFAAGGFGGPWGHGGQGPWHR